MSGIVDTGRSGSGPAALLAAGFAGHREGRFTDAEAAYRAVLAQTPEDTDARYLLGLLALDGGRVEEAVTLLMQVEPQPAAASHPAGGASADHDSTGAAAGIAPGDLTICLVRAGNRLLRLGRPRAALICFERSLAAAPQAAEIYNNRAIALQSLQRFAEALDSYDTALRYRPEYPEAHNNRGNALRDMRRPREALACYDAALRLQPAFAQALNNRGNVLRDLGHLSDALASYSQALLHQPEFALAESNRGQVLLDLKRPAAALADFERALPGMADDADTRFGYALALLQVGRAAEALEAFEQAQRLGVEESEVLVGQAAALAELQRHAAAADRLERLLQRVPDYDFALGSLVHSRLHSCDWSDLAQRRTQVGQLIGDGRRVSYPQSLLPLLDSAPLQQQCAQTLVAARYPQAPARMSPAAVTGPDMRADARADRRIRVAYVSADFGEHPVSQALVGVLEHHDRRHFEVIGVSLAASREDATAQRLRAACDQWLEVGDSSDRDAAATLAERRVDIAVDLMGFTQGMRLGIFAHRAAPVQVNYLGYAGTLGAPYIDYLLADEIVIPRGEEPWYTEKVVRLPHCCLPTDDRRRLGASPLSRAQAGLPQQGLVLCAFTNAYKINPPIFDIWMRLLAAAPGSVLWLRVDNPDAADNLRRQAQARGIAAERLAFAPRLVVIAEHWARYQLADLYLDTLPYNAHSTACDALAAGLPLLTCAGRSFAARIAASALTAAGLRELITTSLAQYQQRGLELVQSPQRLAALRSRLQAARRDGELAPLFDTRAYTAGLEAAYRQMWKRHRHGLSPESFDVHAAVAGERIE